MPESFANPWRGSGIPSGGVRPLHDVAPVAELLARCPVHAPTPLHRADVLAREMGLAELWVKDERGRMGLGSFKALGAAHVLARAAVARNAQHPEAALAGETFLTASAGNHGLSVAAGARVFGARAVIYLARTVPEAFAERLRRFGADVVWAGADYEASMAAAQARAEAEGWQLLSDSSWNGYIEPPLRVMQGYLQMAAEAAGQINAPPSHIILQAGVGGLAGAVAAYARATWGDDPQILVVEPAAAPALMQSVREGKLATAPGPVSSMGRLDCKTPSLIALAGLSHDADVFVTITEEDAARGCEVLARHDLETTPSGGAGLAALIAGLDLPRDARVLAILSEGPEDV